MKNTLFALLAAALFASPVAFAQTGTSNADGKMKTQKHSRKHSRTKHRGDMDNASRNGAMNNDAAGENSNGSLNNGASPVNSTMTNSNSPANPDEINMKNGGSDRKGTTPVR